MLVSRILFICTGNTCRSPIAEGLFRQMIAEEKIDVEVRSAGVSALGGLPISENSQKVLEKKGVSDTGQESTMLTREWAEWADLILTMTMNHKRTLISRYPQAAEKTFTLKEFVDIDENKKNLLKEREKLIAELVLKKATFKSINEKERKKLFELDEDLPNMDIPDPYGGPLELYEQSAGEIEMYLRRVIDKIKMPNGAS